MKMKTINTLLLSVLFIALVATTSAETLFTPIETIISNPTELHGKFVSVIGYYTGWRNAPGRPPVTRSDWVIVDDNDLGIYCTGLIPDTFDPHAPSSYRREVNLLAKVNKGQERPYLEVIEVKPMPQATERMTSVSGILFDPLGMNGQYVGLLGVLAKGFGVRGDRMYLLADPSGAIKLGRLPKLYPTGTILRIKGYVTADENGLPMIDRVEIIDAQVIFD